MLSTISAWGLIRMDCISLALPCAGQSSRLKTGVETGRRRGCRGGHKPWLPDGVSIFGAQRAVVGVLPGQGAYGGGEVAGEDVVDVQEKGFPGGADVRGVRPGAAVAEEAAVVRRVGGEVEVAGDDGARVAGDADGGLFQVVLPGMGELRGDGRRRVQGVDGGAVGLFGADVGVAADKVEGAGG